MNGMKKQKAAIDLTAIVREAEEPREIVRVTVSLSKGTFDKFKRRCGGVPVSRVMDRLLDEVTKEEVA